LEKPGAAKIISAGYPSVEQEVTKEEDSSLISSITKAITEHKESVKQLEEGTKPKGITVRLDENDIFFSLVSEKTSDNTYPKGRSLNTSLTISNKESKVLFTVELTTKQGGKNKHVSIVPLDVVNEVLVDTLTKNKVTSAEDLIKILNRQIEFYSVGKGGASESKSKTSYIVLDNGVPLKVGGIFKRVDQVEPESNEAKKLNQLRLNATVSSRVLFSPKNLPKETKKNNPKATAPTGQFTRKPENQDTAFNDFIKFIDNTSDEGILRPGFIDELDKNLKDMTLAEMDIFWNEAKNI
jgi:hypothetical protein